MKRSLLIAFTCLLLTLPCVAASAQAGSSTAPTAPADSVPAPTGNVAPDEPSATNRRGESSGSAVPIAATLLIIGTIGVVAVLARAARKKSPSAEADKDRRAA